MSEILIPIVNCDVLEDRPFYVEGVVFGAGPHQRFHYFAFKKKTLLLEKWLCENLLLVGIISGAISWNTCIRAMTYNHRNRDVDILLQKNLNGKYCTVKFHVRKRPLNLGISKRTFQGLIERQFWNCSKSSWWYDIVINFANKKMSDISLRRQSLRHGWSSIYWIPANINLCRIFKSTSLGSNFAFNMQGG